MAWVGKAIMLGGVAALFAPLAPLHATPTPDKSHAVAPRAKKKIAVEIATADPMKSIALGSFTPSLVDPSRAAAVRPQVERAFKFTPSGRTGDRKALTIGLTSRAAAPAVADTHADTIRPIQTAYNVGGSIDWLGFSLTGGYSRIEAAYGPRREGVDLGLTYRGNRWKTTLLAVSETPSHIALDPLTMDKRSSLELGGAYSLNSRLSLSAGARYQMITPLDPRLQSEKDPSVFIGTAFTF